MTIWQLIGMIIGAVFCLLGLLLVKDAWRPSKETLRYWKMYSHIDHSYTKDFGDGDLMSKRRGSFVLGTILLLLPGGGLICLSLLL